MPALFTSTSIGPAVSASATAFAIEAGSSRSSCNTSIGSLSASRAFVSSLAFAVLRIVAKTWSPFRANSSAVSSPKPLLHPVINTFAILGAPSLPSLPVPGRRRGLDCVPCGVYNFSICGITSRATVSIGFIVSTPSSAPITVCTPTSAYSPSLCTTCAGELPSPKPIGRMIVFSISP
jgi:hypothetical protein